MSTSKPATAEEIAAAFGSINRLRVLQAMKKLGPTYFSAIRDEAGVNPGSMAVILRDLENGHMITGDLPPGDRKGRTVRYSLNQKRLDAVIDAVTPLRSTKK